MVNLCGAYNPTFSLAGLPCKRDRVYFGLVIQYRCSVKEGKNMNKLLKKYEKKLAKMLDNNSWLTEESKYNLLVEIVNYLRKENNK